MTIHANAQRIARAGEGEYLLNDEQRLISIQLRPCQFDRRRNQVCAAELKGYFF